MSTTLTTSVDYWVGQIRPRLDRAAEELIAAGAYLVEAKAALPHGQFGALLDELEMTPRTAQRFMAIAKNVVLSDATRVSLLPSAWGTLYELSRVPDEVLEAAIDSGQVTTGTTRAEAAALHSPDERTGPLSAAEEERFAALEYAIDAGLKDIEEAGGIGRLRLLDALLRGVDEADEADVSFRTVLLSIVIGTLDRVPDRDEGPGSLGELSTAIGTTLRHLWSGEHEAASAALVAVAAAAAVRKEVRPDVLLQVLDGRPVDQVHPVTRLVVDAVLAGFAVEVVPA